jgi:hypothetical protein
VQLEVTSRNPEVFLFTKVKGTAYVLGDPVNFNDPTGMNACDPSDDADTCATAQGCEDEHCAEEGIVAGGDPYDVGATFSVTTFEDVSASDGSAYGDFGDSVSDYGDFGDSGSDPAVSTSNSCADSFTAIGRGIFGMIGIDFGSQLGILLGSGGGTLVEPGGGTFVGGVVGAALGGAAGGYMGYGAGGAIGGLLGNVFCSSDHTKGKRQSTKPKHQKRKARKKRDLGRRADPPRKRPDWWPNQDGPWPPSPGDWQKWGRR